MAIKKIQIEVLNVHLVKKISNKLSLEQF